MNKNSGLSTAKPALWVTSAEARFEELFLDITKGGANK